MSAFTEWNGPPAGRGPSTKDVLALIEAYNNLNVILTKHIADTGDDGVHGFKSELEGAIKELDDALSAAVSAKADGSVVEELAEKVSANGAAIADEAARAIAAETELSEALDAEAVRAASEESALSGAVEALEKSLEDTKETFSQALSMISFDDDMTTTVTGALAATEYFIGMVRVEYLVDYVGWSTIRAQFAGTGSSDGATKTNGVYILGRLSEEWSPDKGFTDEFNKKGARVYIKYVNDRPFDLVVDITSTAKTYGKIACVASFKKEWTSDDPDDAWEDMTLHLLTNTDSSGAAHVYLGISARGLSGQSTIFHVAGENFIAGGTVNGISSSIGFTRISPGFNCYRANFDDLRVMELHDNQGSPMLKVTYWQDENYAAHKLLTIADTSFTRIYFSRRPSVLFDEDNGDGTVTEYVAPVLTGYDLDAIDAGMSVKGIICFWPQWESATVSGVSVKRAVNVPEGWIACDGSTVLLEDYPTLAEILGLPETATSATLPRIDYGIMRLYTLFENVELDEGSQAAANMTHAELTEAYVNLKTALTEETVTRAEEDAVLQSNIDAEAQARQDADAALQANIDAEAAARQAADDAEAQARQDADAALQANIDAEEAARQAADADLDSKKAEAFEGSKAEFDAAKSGLADGTIVLSPDDLNH